MMSPAIPMGTFTSSRTVPIAFIPTDEKDGLQLRALSILIGEDQSNDPYNFWTVQVGRLVGTQFKALSAASSLSGGVVANRLTDLQLASPVPVSRGDIVAVRFTMTGLAPPLSSVSLVPWWDILSSSTVR